MASELCQKSLLSTPSSCQLFWFERFPFCEKAELNPGVSESNCL